MKFMTNSVSVGIDILDLRNMPNYFGRNEKRFFKDNYSKSEIDSILKKNDIRKYFGILFSLKESIVKCEKKYLGQLFNEIKSTQESIKKLKYLKNPRRLILNKIEIDK